MTAISSALDELEHHHGQATSAAKARAEFTALLETIAPLIGLARLKLDRAATALEPFYPGPQASAIVADAWQAQAKAFEHQLAELRRDLRWVGHTVHQAHHQGVFDECKVHTCDAIRQALAKGGAA